MVSAVKKGSYSVVSGEGKPEDLKTGGWEEGGGRRVWGVDDNGGKWGMRKV